MKTIVISNIEEINILIENVNRSIDLVIDKIKVYEGESKRLFYQLKFLAFGKDPLTERDLNFIEQLNQSYTYLVSFYAVKYLIENHPYCGNYKLNLGTASGSDIESDDGMVIAEVFAATSIASNQKMQKDIEKLKKADTAKIKYLFYHTPVEDSKQVERFLEMNKEIQIVKINF